MKVSHIPPFGVRMPQELKVKIEEAAKRSGRSINAEIVYRLQKSIDADEALTEMINKSVYSSNAKSDWGDVIEKINSLKTDLNNVIKVFSHSKIEQKNKDKD